MHMVGSARLIELLLQLDWCWRLLCHGRRLSVLFKPCFVDKPPLQPWGNVCPARYFSSNYPDFSPRFTLSWRSPPSRPHCTAHLPYKARCIIKQYP